MPMLKMFIFFLGGSVANQLGLNPFFSKNPPKQINSSDQTTEVILQLKTVIKEISSLKNSQLVLNVISGVLCFGLAVFCVKAAVDHFNPFYGTQFNSLGNELKTQIPFTVEHYLAEVREIQTKLDNFQIQFDNLRNESKTQGQLTLKSAEYYLTAAQEIQTKLDILQLQFDLKIKDRPSSANYESISAPAIRFSVTEIAESHGILTADKITPSETHSGGSSLYPDLYKGFYPRK